MNEIPFILLKHGFLNEIEVYKTKANYKLLFDELSDDVKKDLYEEALCCLEYFSIDLEKNYISTIILDSVKKISSIYVDIEIFANKYTLQDDDFISKIGFIVSISEERGKTLQTISFLNFNIMDKTTFLHYIFNTLFYLHIFFRDFRYHPMLKYFYYYEDIDDLVEIKNRRNRLFGDSDNECCVCLDPTINKTLCEHFLCIVCSTKLLVKACPICRKSLYESTSSDEINNNNNNLQPSTSDNNITNSMSNATLASREDDD